MIFFWAFCAEKYHSLVIFFYLCGKETNRILQSKISFMNVNAGNIFTCLAHEYDNNKKKSEEEKNAYVFITSYLLKPRNTTVHFRIRKSFMPPQPGKLKSHQKIN